VRVTPTTQFGPKLVPVIYWYDKTHVCRTQFYRDFVFGGGSKVPIPSGQFIEHVLGNAIRADCIANGMEVHHRYAMLAFCMHASRLLLCVLCGINVHLSDLCGTVLFTFLSLASLSPFLVLILVLSFSFIPLPPYLSRSRSLGFSRSRSLGFSRSPISTSLRSHGANPRPIALCVMGRRKCID
jgi:hypothetical protein